MGRLLKDDCIKTIHRKIRRTILWSTLGVVNRVVDTRVFKVVYKTMIM